MYLSGSWHLASLIVVVHFDIFCPGENVKSDEFMNMKKSHEVQAMSELISCLADYCGIKQVRGFCCILGC